MCLFRAMLTLPRLLDCHVRTILAEALANGLKRHYQRAVLPVAMDPDDRICEPIGMDRDLLNF